jgi:hypothetical protein
MDRCHQCKAWSLVLIKVTKEPPAVVQPIPVSSRRFNLMHVDIVGPFSVSTRSYSYLLFMALIHTWVCHFGMPSVITSDRGLEFTSTMWRHICLLLPSKQHTHSQLKKPPTCQVCWCNMAWKFALDIARPGCYPSRGFSSLLGRIGIWSTAYSSWLLFRWYCWIARADFCGYLTRRQLLHLPVPSPTLRWWGNLWSCCGVQPMSTKRMEIMFHPFTHWMWVHTMCLKKGRCFLHSRLATEWKLCQWIVWNPI